MGRAAVHGVFGAAGVLALLTTTAAAQDDFEPSPLIGADVTTVTRVELDAALEARAACRAALDVLNEDGLRWGRVRAGTLKLTEFRRQVDNASYSWGTARGGCGKARELLPGDILTRRVLDHDARRFDRLRAAMRTVETLWIDRADVEEVNQALRGYRTLADEYATWTATASDFWQGGWLRETTSKGCVEDIDAEVRLTASALRRQVVRPEAERDDEALMKFDTVLASIETARVGCEPESDGARMELEILGRLITVYRAALEGLAGGDDVQVQEAMEAEQTATARRARCAHEHAAGAPSTLCRPGTEATE